MHISKIELENIKSHVNSTFEFTRGTIAITGDEKRALLEQAIADGHSSKLPIGRILAEAEQPIDIHWCP